MPESRWQRMVELFEQLVTLPPASRRQKLDELDADEDLRTALERLLAGHEQASGILEHRELVGELAEGSTHDLDAGRTITLQKPVGRAPAVLEVGSTIGPYRLEEVLGEGGMGVVYRAHQETPIRRDVALKVIRFGVRDPELDARFQVERQALAAMDHPGIARVYEAGATLEGNPYFVMELATGLPITEYCDRQRSSLRERLELFAEVCDAVQHAHQRGVIHRDLKPSNVLVATVDGRPVPKVIDFGVAKPTDPALFEQTLTRDQRLIGTPAYMSPEQWEGARDIDTRTDVYSLSVLLYRLLVGALPIEPRDGEGLVGFGRRLSDEEPITPGARLSMLEEREELAALRGLDARSLGRALRGDLQRIVVKGMARRRDHRYASAAELGDDVRRHLRGDPIAARPERLYRLRKLARKHRAVVIAATAVLATLVAGLVVTSRALVEARRAQARAEEEAAVADSVSRFLNEDLLRAALIENSGGHEVTVREVVDRASRELDELAGPPVVEARIRRSLGAVYHSLGDYDAALELLREAVRLSAETVGAEHPATIAASIELGMALKSADDRPGAEALLVAGVAAAERVLGPDHRETLLGRNVLANLYTDQGRLDEALALHNDNVERWQRLGAEHQTDVATSKSNLANALGARGDFDRTLALRLDALELFESALGDDHATTVRAVGLVGANYVFAGRPAEAEPYLRRSVAGLERLLGPSHPHTLNEMNNLATCLGKQGKYEEAEALARRAVAGMEEAVPPGDPNFLGARHNLGSIVDLGGRPAEGEAILSSVIADASRWLPAGHWYVGVFRGSHGICLTHLGRFEEAEAELRAALDALEPALAAGHPQIVKVLEGLVDLYERWGRTDQAASYRERLSALRAAAQSPPPSPGASSPN